MIKALSANSCWKHYELIDTGDFEKLERFGRYVLRRPEPQAVWSKSLSEKEWERMSDAQFMPEASHSGNWKQKSRLEDPWYLDYQYKGMKLRFKLSLTRFKHVGIFPEQAINWNYIYESCKQLENPRVLNLFAYTGGASLAARAGGAEVVHCDSVKQVLNWANDNMRLSKLSDIRWLLEDAFKFVMREAKRGRKYQGIILDPPAYGIGPKGEKWKLEHMVNDLSSGVAQILNPQESFLVFNSYSLGFSPLILQNLVRTHFQEVRPEAMEMGELCMVERSGRRLPMGIFTRFKR